MIGGRCRSGSRRRTDEFVFDAVHHVEFLNEDARGCRWAGCAEKASLIEVIPWLNALAEMDTLILVETTKKVCKCICPRFFLRAFFYVLSRLSFLLLSRLEDAAHEGPLQHRLVFKDRYSTGHLKKKTEGGEKEGEKK